MAPVSSWTPPTSWTWRQLFPELGATYFLDLAPTISWARRHLPPPEIAANYPSVLPGPPPKNHSWYKTISSSWICLQILLGASLYNRPYKTYLTGWRRPIPTAWKRPIPTAWRRRILTAFRRLTYTGIGKPALKKAHLLWRRPTLYPP